MTLATNFSSSSSCVQPGSHCREHGPWVPLPRGAWLGCIPCQVPRAGLGFTAGVGGPSCPPRSRSLSIYLSIHPSVHLSVPPGHTSTNELISAAHTPRQSPHLLQCPAWDPTQGNHGTSGQGIWLQGRRRVHLLVLGLGLAHAGDPNLPPTCSDALHLCSHCSTPKILILIQGPATQAVFLGSLFTQGCHGYVTSPKLVQKQPCHLLAHVLQGDQHPHGP